MSKRALILRLKREAERIDTDDTVRQISDLMDELSAAVHGGSIVEPQTIHQLMEEGDVTQSSPR